MASLLSPGVITREIDLTTVTPAVASTEGGIAMHAQWGPAEKLVLVTDELDLVDVFGKPNNHNASDWFTAKNFLSYSGALYVSRALPDGALNSSNGAAGILIKNLDDYERQTYTDGEWAAKYPGALGNSLKISLADESTFDNWVYKSLFSEKPDLDGLHIVVVDEDGLISGDKGTVLERYEFLSKFSDGKSEDGSSLYYKKVINDTSEYIWSLDHYPSMIGWGDTAEEHLTFDPSTGEASHKAGSNGSSIMLSYTTILNDSSPGTFETHTLTIERKLVDDDSDPATPDVPEDFDGSEFSVGAVVSQTIGGDTVEGTVQSWTWQPVANPDYDDQIPEDPITNPATLPREQGILVVVSEEPFQTGSGVEGVDGYEVSAVSSSSDPADTDPVVTTLNAEHSLANGADGTISKALDRVNAMDLFVDDELVDISFLLGGEIPTDDKSIVNKIFDIVSSRQDCLGVISPEKEDCVNAIDPAGDVKDFRNSLNVGGLKDLKGSFMVMDDNWKYQFDKYNNLNRWVPCNGDTAGLMAETDLERAAWFSPGGRSLKNVIKLAWKSKKAERDVLYPLGVNSVTTFPGEGAILYGDRTMLKRPSAFDRINVRRLFIVLRKTISRTARSFLFELNTEFTRERFKSTVIPFLEEVQGRQGITDFLVVCDETNNTGQVIDQNRFIGDIYIKPARSINFIELNFVAVRTDVEFSEVVGSV